MGKKRAAKQEAQRTRKEPTVKNPSGAKYVRVETMVVVALAALVFGFFGGEILQRSKPSTQQPGQPPMPTPAGRPSQGAGGPTVEQAGRILALEKDVAADPGNVAAWTELGHTYFDANQFEKAIQAYNRALALRPENPDVWTDLGVMYRRNKQPLEAIAAFEKAIAINPRHEVSRFNKGVVLMHDLDDREAAMKAWEELLEMNPDAKTPDGQPMKALLENLRPKNGQSGDAP